MDTDRDDLEGELGTVTDEEWRAAHLRVFEQVYAAADNKGQADRLARQFAYQWAPGVVADGQQG